MANWLKYLCTLSFSQGILKPIRSALTSWNSLCLRFAASVSGLLLVNSLVWICCSSCCAQIILRLPPNVTVHSRNVRMIDIVTPSVADQRAALMLRLADVATIKPDSSEVEIKKSFLRIRLMLAGWSEDRFRIDGPDTVVVRFEEGRVTTDSDVEKAATETMAVVLGARDEDLRVRLSRPFMQSLPSALQTKYGLRVEVSAPVRAEPGTTSLTVRLWDGRNLALTRTGRFDVLKKHRVAVSRVSLQRDVTIDRDDVQFENRFLPAVTDEPQEEDIYGQRVRTPVRAGQILSLRDVSRPLPQERVVVIRSHDKVQVTAISGPLKIRMRQAEALQQGRIGDIISVRNVESREVITGRVTGPGAVEIRIR